MKFEEIKVNEIYKIWDDEHKVVYKHEESRVVFTLEVGSDSPYAWTEHHLNLFEPITLPETGLLVTEAGSIVYRTGKDSGYGFSRGKYWYDNDLWKKFTTDRWRKAALKDEEKFKELLIKEAANHGLVDGVEFESVYSVNKWVVNTEIVRFDYKGFTMGVGYVFYNGKWATPIKNEKQDELDSTIEKLFKLAEELGVDVTLIIDGKNRKSWK